MTLQDTNSFDNPDRVISEYLDNDFPVYGETYIAAEDVTIDMDVLSYVKWEDKLYAVVRTIDGEIAEEF